MSLEFARIVEKVDTMARHLAHRANANSSRIERALELLYTVASDLDFVHDRIALVRSSSVSGYRGAAPAPKPYDEAIPGVGALPAPPAAATIVAVDGSQVYPDAHEAALYYLINMGIFCYYYGVTRLPDQATHPELYYSDSVMLDKDNRPITNQAVNMRRSVMEMQWLAREAWSRQDEARPLLAVHDGALLKFFGAADVSDAGQLEDDYMEALVQLHDAGALLIGYGDRPRGAALVSLLHLLRLHPREINDVVLRNNGDLEGLSDSMLYSHILQPGERSALLTQNSPQNKEYSDRGDMLFQGQNHPRYVEGDFEVAYFFINVADVGAPKIVRVDLPMWVGRSREAIDAIHALVMAQCSIQGRKRYPYVLTRADEMAYVSSPEKAHLDEMIRIAMRGYGLEPEASNKLQSKDLARASRTLHKLR